MSLQAILQWLRATLPGTNWDSVRATGLGLLVATGAVATTLSAVGMSQEKVTYTLGVLGSLVGLVCTVGPIVAWVLQRTDQGKANGIERLDPAGKAAVLEKLPAETKLAAVNALPGVVNIEVAKNATNGTRTAALDPSLDKVNLSSTVIPVGKI